MTPSARSASARDPARERLLSSLLLAVLLHALAFAALEIFLKLRPQRIPEYRGPLVVQLEELPVVRQALRPAPSAPSPARGAPGAPGAAAPAAGVTVSPVAPPPLPSGPPLRAAPSASAAAPASGQAPSGSPFRVEGAPPQEGPPRPAGQGFQVPSPEPTLPPPAGAQAQGAPLRATAPGEGPAARGQAPAVPLENLDRALEAGSAARAAGGAGAGAGAPGSAGAPSGAGRADSSQEGFSIVLPDSVKGREVLFMPKIQIPKWVSEAGLRLTGEISFDLTPQGVLLNSRTLRSSGYSDVDTVVLDAVRRMKFQPGPREGGNVSGSVTYLIVPEG